MDGRKDVTKDSEPTDTRKLPEVPAEADQKSADEKDTTAPVEISQIPMDGICGGY